MIRVWGSKCSKINIWDHFLAREHYTMIVWTDLDVTGGYAILDKNRLIGQSNQNNYGKHQQRLSSRQVLASYCSYVLLLIVLLCPLSLSYLSENNKRHGWSSPRSEVKASGWLQNAVTKTQVTCCDEFSSSSVVSHAFSAPSVYSKFGYHPHPLGYLCAKFCFCRALYCWARPERKTTYSISQSLNYSPSLFDAPGTEAFASE